MTNILQVQFPLATIHKTADGISEATNQLLFGETLEVLENAGNGWSKIRSLHDQYEGYVSSVMLGSAVEATHIINVPLTHIYSEAAFKSLPMQPAYMQSRICLNGNEQDGFCGLQSGGWVYKSHIRAIDAVEKDFVATALAFEGAPYLWGGRSQHGIDCSGLVQIALGRAGIDCPRDSGDQMTTLGTKLDGRAALQRGDLVFFKGHVGIMLDEQNMINARSHHMLVVSEPLQDVMNANDSGLLEARRL